MNFVYSLIINTQSREDVWATVERVPLGRPLLN